MYTKYRWASTHEQNGLKPVYCNTAQVRGLQEPVNDAEEVIQVNPARWVGSALKILDTYGLIYIWCKAFRKLF